MLISRRGNAESATGGDTRFYTKKPALAISSLSAFNDFADVCAMSLLQFKVSRNKIRN